MTAIRCLCASVVAFLLNGRSSSVPKPGIHMFQFLSRTIWILKLTKWKISMIIPEHPVHQYCLPSCAWQGHRPGSQCAQWSHQQSEKPGAKTVKRAETLHDIRLLIRRMSHTPPVEGRPLHPRPTVQQDQLPWPAHTAFSCPKPIIWLETLLSIFNGTWVSELKLTELVGWPPTELTLDGRLLVRAGCCPDIPDAVWWLAGVPEAWLLILHSGTSKPYKSLSIMMNISHKRQWFPFESGIQTRTNTVASLFRD